MQRKRCQEPLLIIRESSGKLGEWNAHRQNEGNGHVYQGRFKSFLLDSDEHLWTVCRYGERNLMRAGLRDRAEQWRWSSLWRFVCGVEATRKLLCPWPMDRPPRLDGVCQSRRDVEGIESTPAVRESLAAVWERPEGRADHAAFRIEFAFYVLAGGQKTENGS
jgi:hypothetical protein